MTGYTVHTRTIQGSSHKKAGNKPCQDRLLVRQSEGALLLAVADGHGGACYCRSGFGARLACQAAAAVLLSGGLDDQQAAAALKDKFDSLVRKHLAFRPLSDKEQALLHGRPDFVAYGTTLVAAVIRAEDTAVYQIGDGGVYLLDDTGFFLPALAEDKDCYGCITSSMAYDNDRYLNHIRIRHYPGRPAAAMLFSDGYGFSSPLPWQAACILRQPDRLESALDQLLREGDHGDDQSFILACAPDKITAPAFWEGLAAEETKGKLAIRLDGLQEEYQRRYCWLELALQKGRRLKKQPARAEEFAQFKELLRERLAEFANLRQEMESLQKQLKGPA